MLTQLNPFFAFFLVAGTATAYAVATIGMKLASVGPTPAAYGFIMVGLIGAVLGEIILLRSASLTVIYIGIVVFESLLVLTYATYTSGHLNMPQLLGAALVIGGFAVVTMTE